MEKTIELAGKYKVRMRAWVRALRSGKFKQGHNTLLMRKENEFGKRVDVGYCCLGVAEVVRGASRATIIRNNMLTPNGQKYYGLHTNEDDLSFDLENPTIAFTSYGKGISASKANDGLHWSFKEIANAIERTYNLKIKKGKKG